VGSRCFYRVSGNRSVSAAKCQSLGLNVYKFSDDYAVIRNIVDTVFYWNVNVESQVRHSSRVHLSDQIF
jgi:hypothetical protein